MVESLKDDWDSKKDHVKNITNDISEKIIGSEEKINAHATKINANERFSDNEIEKLIAKIEKMRIEKEEELNNLIESEKKRVDLKASQSYWADKSDQHKIWAGVSGLVTIVLSLVILAFIFYGDIPKEFLNQSWVEIQLWKVFSAFGVASLAIWMIRISAKIFISHLHLKTDADERVTMMNTYLALTAEGKALPDEQRDIILQVLFRPSSTGYIKEDNTPLDSFTRIIEKNRATH